MDAALKDIFDMRVSAMTILGDMADSGKGYSTGLDCIDEVVNGYKPGEFIIIAGVPTMGKSSFARGSALEISKHNVVLLVSLEMGSKELSELCLTSIAELSYDDVIKGNCSDKNSKKLIKATGELSERKLLIWDSSFITPGLLDQKIEALNSVERVDCVIVDYLQLMSTPVRENRQVEIASISRELKLLATKYNIPVIALSQLNRQCEARDNKRPKLSDLRDSGALGQDVDKCLLIHRPAYYDQDNEDDGVAEIIIAKNRKGPRNKTIACGWVAEFMRFYDMKKYNEF